MSFASEVAAMKSGETAAPPTLPVPASEAAPVEFNMPQHGEAHPETPSQVETLQPQPKSGPIKIGNEVFNTPEEAIAYATEMQSLLVQRDAYELGRQSVQPTVAAPPAPDEFEELGNELFENPKEAIKKIYNKAKADAISEYKTDVQRSNDIKATWDNFYSQNADLAPNREIVDYVMQKNWDQVGALPVDKALKVVAEKTRALLGSQKVAALPSRELPSGQVVSPNATGVQPVATPTKPAQPLDFISQVNKMRRRSGPQI